MAKTTMTSRYRRQSNSYIALKDVGVETVFVRYPREGHGIREPKHVVDWIDRSIEWHESHFGQAVSGRPVDKH